MIQTYCNTPPRTPILRFVDKLDMGWYFFLNSQMLSLYTFSSSIQSLSRFVNRNLDFGGSGGEAPQKSVWDFNHMSDDFKHKI